MSFQHHSRIPPLVRVASAVLVLSCLFPGLAAAASPMARPPHTITVIASTIPANGDVNPYGIYVVPDTIGSLVKGNILISNFNAASKPARNRNNNYADIPRRHRQPVRSD